MSTIILVYIYKYHDTRDLFGVLCLINKRISECTMEAQGQFYPFKEELQGRRASWRRKEEAMLLKLPWRPDAWPTSSVEALEKELSKHRMCVGVRAQVCLEKTSKEKQQNQLAVTALGPWILGRQRARIGNCVCLFMVSLPFYRWCLSQIVLISQAGMLGLHPDLRYYSCDRELFLL